MREAIFVLVFIPFLASAGPRGFDLETHASRKYGNTIEERVDRLSSLFLGMDYVVDPLGEGKGGAHDQDPLYRFDAFDCTTFVETVLALGKSESKAAFEKNLNRIRYRDGIPSYISRNHFPDADWRPHLLKLGVLKDITGVIAGDIPLRRARAKVDKRKWFAQRLPAASRSEADGLGLVETTVPYLPFDSFFEKRPNGYLVPSAILERIPSGTVFNIVRTRYRPSDKVGTELSIWHQGFLIRKKGELWVRHATHLGAGHVTEARAVDFLLAEYLRKINVGSKDHGINFLGLKESAPN